MAPWRKTLNPNISSYRGSSRLSFCHFVVPSSTSKRQSESLLGHLCFEIFFFKVEISSLFSFLKKSYLHKFFMSSPSRVYVKKRLLYLSEGSSTCRWNFYVHYILQLRLKKKFCHLLTHKMGGPFLTTKKAQKGQNFDFISTLKKKYLQIPKSYDALNLQVGSTK